MTNQWIFKTYTEEQKKQSDKLSKELGISPILSGLLIDRGVSTFEEARAYFRPDLDNLHDPFLMADMDKAVERLTQAINNKEKILVYGDYDVDGTTSVSLVYKFIKSFYDNVEYYIPDRYDEGYGISYKGIDYAVKKDMSLVIALDCGIKAVDKIEYANERQIDFIICDHHTPDDVLPAAVAVLDPKRKDCGYPYKELSGCGVGFKLVQAFSAQNNIPFEKLIPLLDLVVLSIASDIVPITGENRILAYHGLEQLNSNPSVGVKSILDVCGLLAKDPGQEPIKEITISDIVFKIGPRINASGRMKLATEAVDLMVSMDSSFAKKKSNIINKYNNERKDLDQNITKEAIAIISSDEERKKRKSIVIYKPDWHKGVIGIVASRLSEEFYKPSIVLTYSKGKVSGSARSVPGFDIYSAIDYCSKHLENFGGHRYAAGLTLTEDKVEAFSACFEEYVAKHITEEQLSPQIKVDALIEFKDITHKFFKVLKQFAPFGPGNMKPVFVSEDVKDFGFSRLVGRDQEHLKLSLVDDSSEEVMDGIAFGMHAYNDHLKSMKPLDICYTIEENTYMGNTKIQLMIKDIKV